jgi:transposase InsO family protein
MRSYTLAAKMAELGISLSFSRPRVSNDNAYVESWFRTMKYHQSYPVRRFRDLLSVRAWVDGFVGGTTQSTVTAASSTSRRTSGTMAKLMRSARSVNGPISRLVNSIHAAGPDHLAIGLSHRSCG